MCGGFIQRPGMTTRRVLRKLSRVAGAAGLRTDKILLLRREWRRARQSNSNKGSYYTRQYSNFNANWINLGEFA